METPKAFSQPIVAHELALALYELERQGAPALSPRVLAEAVSKQFPAAPLPVLCVFAASILRLHFELPTVADIRAAGLTRADEISASEFFGAAFKAQATALRNRRSQG